MPLIRRLRHARRIARASSQCPLPHVQRHPLLNASGRRNSSSSSSGGRTHTAAQRAPPLPPALPRIQPQTTFSRERALPGPNQARQRGGDGAFLLLSAASVTCIAACAGAGGGDASRRCLMTQASSDEERGGGPTTKEKLVKKLKDAGVYAEGDGDGNGNSDGNKGEVDTGEENKDSAFDVAVGWINDMTGEGVKIFNERIFNSEQQGGAGEANGGEQRTTKTGMPEAKRQGGIEDIVREFLKGKGPISDVVGSSVDDSGSSTTAAGDKGPSSVDDGFLGAAMSFFDGMSKQSSEDKFHSLVERARDSAMRGDGSEVRETRSFAELASLFAEKAGEVNRVLDESFRHVDVTKLTPDGIWYYLELEDERKNPSWKRRMHRYHRGVDVEKVKDLNEALSLADLSYSDTVDAVREGLESAKEPWELIYCKTESLPEEPGHFLAVKRGQSRWGNSLEVVLVVRGTKSVEDVLTDALCKAEEYRGGKAHAGIVRSGRYLVDKHRHLLQQLLKMSGKKRLDLSLIGHSLGAGAATIAGMELMDQGNIDVSVTGFGCPALLSRELSESTRDYVTTIVGDSDVVPRMSAATVGNVALDIMEYDYTPKARRDVEQLLGEIQANSSGFVGQNEVERAMSFVDSVIDDIVRPGIKESTEERLEPVLFPPGTCIHFYRDGSGISGSYAPCTFFNEIDVSRTMVDDHLIGAGYNVIFLELMRRYHKNVHFSFDNNK